MSLAEARRLALAAQGLADPRPSGRIDRRHLRKVLDRVGMLQLDSVNVVVRSHELPLFSRLGPYPRPALAAMAAPGGELFEYWGHEASLLPVTWHPLVRWRMERAANGRAWRHVAELARSRPAFVEDVLAHVRDGGAVSVGDVPDGGSRSGPWWGWSDAKRALEWHFWCGRLAATRTPTFTRVYDLPERIIPAEVLAQPTPSADEAQRQLLLLAARSLGVGTATDLAEWFRLNAVEARGLVRDLAAEGQLEQVAVDGWRDPAFVLPGTVVPRRVPPTTLVAPFDSVLWNRPRVERLHDFHFRLELYVPAPKRVYGYYVVGVLHRGRFAGRLDLKADRASRQLRVGGAWSEAHVGNLAELAEATHVQLSTLAAWLGLEGGANVLPRGDLGEAMTGLQAPDLMEASPLDEA